MADLRVQYDLRPAYYDQFHCLAGACRFTCCKGWNITFDKKDYLSLKRMEGSPKLTETLQKNVRRIRRGHNAGVWYGEFDLSSGGCPLQREDGLCSLQLEKGADALPEICRSFPRGAAYSDAGYLERCLTPACEGVLELLWDLPDGVDFVADPLPPQKWRDGTFDKTAVLVPRFQDIRGQCIDFLQDRRYPLPQRILMMGVAMKELADGETDVDRWLARAKALAGGPELVQALRTDANKTLPLFLLQNLKVLYESNRDNNYFASVPEEVSTGLGIRMEVNGDEAHAEFPSAPYLAARARFEERFRDHDHFMENLMVSLFFQLNLPNLSSPEELWKGYVSFCSMYSFYRFMAVASCREGASGDKDELFRLMVCASRALIHNGPEKAKLRDEFFQNDSATLAHMAILLSG